MNFPFGKNRLRRSIERGLANGRLKDELEGLGNLSLKSRADAEAVCWGLRQLTKGTAAILAEDAHELVNLFQHVQDGTCAAVEVLREQGIPELLQLFDRLQGSPEQKETTRVLLFILKILALYGMTEGTLKIVAAVRQPLSPDAYMWSVILSLFEAGHPERELLFRCLRDPLPPDLIGVSFLDAANACSLEDETIPHPFDSAEGKQRLRAWLENPDVEEISYAHSATVALPFISNPGRDELLSLAMSHSGVSVQMEAAWAAARLGRRDGLQRLAVYAQDFKHAAKARQYLKELGRPDLIPAATQNPDFEALAEFAQWLAHPNELGRAPAELEIVDHRQLPWPPDQELKPFWLIRYRAKDTTGLGKDDVNCGLVGSTTACLFSYKLADRPPEDAYAVHAYWELQGKRLIEESDVRENPAEYAALLNQWRGPGLENPRMRFVAELAPEVRHPQRLVGLASARVAGNDGWVVLDGDRSEWYPNSELPADVWESVVLKVHLGRQLLGFTGKPDRRKYLPAPVAPKPPEQIIAAYDRLVTETESKPDKARKRAFRPLSLVGKHFDTFVNALVSAGRAAEITAMIQRLAPHWNHYRGWADLGAAAFKCGQMELAEELLLKVRNQRADWECSKSMELLAEIWCRRGRSAEAKALLLEALRRLVAESKSAIDPDQQHCEESFQSRRGAFLRHFPADGQAILTAEGIPDSTLT